MRMVILSCSEYLPSNLYRFGLIARDTLQAFIRVFKLNDETKVEYWTDTDVTYYVYENGSLINDYYYGENNKQTHFSTGSWGRVPFIPFKNNSEEVSDIWQYKTIIDAIDKRLSDTQNMFDECRVNLHFTWLRGREP